MINYSNDVGLAVVRNKKKHESVGEIARICPTGTAVQIAYSIIRSRRL